MRGLSIVTVLMMVLCLSFTASAQMTTYYFSPIPAIGVGPNGLPTKKIDVNPYCCPSTAINVTTQQNVSERDFQWVLIPLSLPQGVIRSVTVCYGIKGKEKAYISQTRITSMTTPNRANVLLDDGTDRHSMRPTCYNVEGEVPIKGTMTLALKVVLNPGDQIRIGSIAVDVEQ